MPEQKRRMLKHPAQSFHKFSQCKFLQENIGLLNYKTLQNYEKKIYLNHETNSIHRFSKCFAG
jgi:hypothetical protein